MNVRRIIAFACVLLTVAGLAACGSSSKPSSTPKHAAGEATSASTQALTTTTGSTTAAAPTGASFTVGMICSCSGAQASIFSGDTGVAKAWALSVNAAGGINGHPVKMITMDDGGNPSTSLQDVKAMVQEDHIQAIVGDMSLADAAWASYISKAGIPVIGGIGQEPTFLSNPDFYPANVQLLVSLVAIAQQAKTAGKTTFGLEYCAESPICAEADPLLRASAAIAGLKYTSGKIAATAPNYTAQCLELKSAGVNAVYIGDDAPIVVRFTDDCAQQGYKFQGFDTITELSKVALADPAMNGTVGVAGTANPYDTSTPAVAQFQTALNKYDPGYVNSPQFTYATMLDWTGDKLFQAAATAGDLSPSSTPAQIKVALYKLHGTTLDGLAPPLTFTPGQPAFIPCWFSAQISNRKFASLNGDKPTCLTTTQTKAVLAILKHL